jgi:ferredoxin
LRRKIIEIDLDKCNGCGLCLPNCPEGALQLIDGKARLISDLFCDGLGACIGHCPEGAILFEEREAEAYDEKKVMENIVKQGPGVILAHLQHLREHNEKEYLNEALAYLSERDVRVNFEKVDRPAEASGLRLGGCPGSQAVSFGRNEQSPASSGPHPSHLTHWPIQLHLINPLAAHYRGSEVLLAADCVAYALGGFHDDYLRGKSLAIACPKLDDGQEVYLEKLQAMIDEAQILSITVMMMQVPCCGGLLNLARQAVALASRKVPIRYAIVGVRGEILQQGEMPATSHP